jgi:hypothetical protein
VREKTPERGRGFSNVSTARDTIWNLKLSPPLSEAKNQSCSLLR